MPLNVKIIDKGFNQYIKEIRNLRYHPSVKIGVMQDKASRQGKVDNVKLMSIHEFGTDKAGKNKDIKIPQRSIIRAKTDNNLDKAFSNIKKDYNGIIKGKQTLYKMIGRTGLFIEGEFKRGFNKTDLVANKESTIKSKKGKDTPLIDTGQLRNSITSKVTK